MIERGKRSSDALRADERTRGRGLIERLFRVSERGSTAGRELRGGLVTFVTMS